MPRPRELKSFTRSLVSLLPLVIGCSAAAPVDAPAQPGQTAAATAAAPPIVAGSSASAAIASAPSPTNAPATNETESKALVDCRRSLSEKIRGYWKNVDKQTSIISTRQLFRAFGETCKDAFPTLAAAAFRASRVGRKERSKLLVRALVDDKVTWVCPESEGADTAQQASAICGVVGVDRFEKTSLLDRLDPGTYAFGVHLRRRGFEMWMIEELWLQASLNPELDK